jgi:glycosyltransferase involved in cell wall biosynthesis
MEVTLSLHSISYVVVTPVRDEEAYLPLTIASMASQTILPREWVIVDDGSRDATAKIAADACARYPWIKLVQRSDRGYRKWGAGIIEAFYSGFDQLSCQDWEFMSKLDGDLSFPPDYFELCFRKFREEPTLGIGGGVLYHDEGGKRVLEKHPLFHVRGGVKIYRRACWDALAGLWVGPGSDTVDEVKANMLGWGSRSFPDIAMTHLRYTGAAWGRWGGLVKDGKIDYVTGYHPLFVAAKLLVRLGRRPIVVGAAAHAYGYLSAAMQRMPQVDDRNVIRYLRRQQLARLVGRKTIWK